jgi:hypothetical protein
MYQKTKAVSVLRQNVWSCYLTKIQRFRLDLASE